MLFEFFSLLSLFLFYLDHRTYKPHGTRIGFGIAICVFFLFTFKASKYCWSRNTGKTLLTPYANYPKDLFVVWEF